MTTTAWEDGGVIPDKYTQAAGATAAVARAQVVAGAAGHAELRAADARSRAGAQQGLEDGHHALADLEHPGHVDRVSRRRRRGRAARRQPPGEPARRTATWAPARLPGPYHHYTFELYALDTKLDVPQGTPQQAADTRTAVINAMDGHVLGKAVLVARFHRSAP